MMNNKNNCLFVVLYEMPDRAPLHLMCDLDRLLFMLAAYRHAEID